MQQLVTGLKQCATAPQLPNELLCVQQALECCLLEQSSTPLGGHAVSRSSLVLHMCARRCARRVDCHTPAPASSLALQSGPLLCDVQAGSLLQGSTSGGTAYHAASQQHCPHHGRSDPGIKVMGVDALGTDAYDGTFMHGHSSIGTFQPGSLLLQGSMRWWLLGCHSSLWPG